MGLAAYSRYRCVYVILKTLMRRFLSAKSQVFESLGVSLKVITHSLRCVASFLPQKQLAWIGERVRNVVDTMQRGGQRGCSCWWCVFFVCFFLAEVAVLTFGHC